MYVRVLKEEKNLCKEMLELMRMYEPKYGIFEPTIGEKILGIGKIALPLVLFIIGLFVVLSKKITKKVKVITISILLTIRILSWIVLNYIANNY